ncbi:MAG TPA: SOS response-associated peptidase [Dehalococcoidia bacterium]|nr:SOS response-associated peptidase [Dehalococcoidia bacterium]
MCGRFTLTYRERERLAEELGVPVEQLPHAEYRPRYNIAPTDSHWIVRLRLEDREILPAKWGLVNSWAKDASRAARQINARAETLATSPAFREAFFKRRCIVPADGFFEWVGAGAHRQPLWFHRPDGGLLLFAGLYESWRPEPDRWQRTFTIVTTRPNNLVLPIHDRMPVILDDTVADHWLDPRQEDAEALQRLLVPAPDSLLVATPVSQRVNSVKNDDQACLEPVEAPPGLF